MEEEEDNRRQGGCLCPTLIPLIVMALPNRLRKKLGGHTATMMIQGGGIEREEGCG